MSNALFVKGAEKILNPLIGGSALTGTLKAALVSDAYTPNLSTHEFYSDISTNVLGTPQVVGTASVTGGKLNGASVTFAAVAAGHNAKYVAIYMDTGTAGTSALLALIDTITGFPVATNGGDITVNWDSGTYKIFSLV